MPSSSSSKRSSAQRHTRQSSAQLATPPPEPSASASSSLTLSPTAPPASSPPPASSKLPRFLQSPLQRDRSKSLSVDRPPSVASSASHSTSHSTSTHSSSSHGSRRFLGIGKDGGMKERDRQRIREAERRAPSPAELLTLQEGVADQDLLILPGPESPTLRASPRNRNHHLGRRFSLSQSTPPSSSGHASDYSGGGGQTLQLQRSPSRLGADSPLATRLSGWFAHLAGSTNDLSLTATVSGALSHSVSTAAALSASASSSSSPRRDDKGSSGKTTLLDKAVRYLLDGDAAPDRSREEIWLMGRRMEGWTEEDEARVAAAAAAESHHHSHSQAWPAQFHAAFHSLVWCTYRAGFEPIRDLPSLSSLPPPLTFPNQPASSPIPGQGHSPSQSDSSEGHASTTSSHVTSSSHASVATSSSNLSTSSKKRWWALGGAGTKGWTSDAGWGCMLRTAQSLLAESLVRVGGGDLGSPEHARLISWFLDASAAPFGVHRMALAGKAVGKDVGMWFGPSAAASAVRTLVDAFPACGLGVSVGIDGALFQTDVYAASHSAPRHHGKQTRWGDRPVLLLLGIRLGLDGVNPVYYDTIKALYTFPQSVGIAGGRPSSSYYFVGVQGDALFYLDPHHSRPAVPLRPYVPGEGLGDARRSLSPEAYARGGSMSPPGSLRAGSMSPELHGMGRGRSPMTEDELFICRGSEEDGGDNEGGGMSPAEAAHYANAYSSLELATFHCARVRKMPLSGLDPSMLIGFVCRDGREWVDLRRRVGKLPRTIFTIQDEPPTWPGADDEDDAMGMESISDPEELEDGDAGVDDGDRAAPASSQPWTFSQTHVHAHSTSSNSGSTASSSGVDTDPPLTPLPNARFDIAPPPPAAKGVRAYPELEADDDDDGEDFVDAAREVDIEDDWVDPVPAPPPLPPPVMKKSKSGAGGGGGGKAKKGKEREQQQRGKKAVPVPVPSVHYPFPVSVEDSAAPLPPLPARAGSTQQRMHTARARDGGRTQSGGVRGILTEDA